MATDLVAGLREIERTEREVSYGLDMRPEDTANWRYADIARDAANELATLRLIMYGTPENPRSFAMVLEQNARLVERRLEVSLERDAILEKLARLSALLIEAIERIKSDGSPEDWRWTAVVERELAVMGESSPDVTPAHE